MRSILRIETSSNNHPTKVPEAVLPAHDEERLIKVGMVFSQFLLLDFSAQPHKHRKRAPTIYRSQQWHSKDECFVRKLTWKADNGWLWVWIPFHLGLFFLLLDHLDLAVFSLCITIAYSAGMLEEEKKTLSKSMKDTHQGSAFRIFREGWRLQQS